MTTYIAEFKAAHKTIQILQHSVFTWKQEGGEIDPELLQGKIKRESSIHFYNLLAGEKHNVTLEDISVEITKTAPFNG
ncbi:GTP-binding protein LepA [uncultured Eudoraea sp.]|uniref:GTP-binding protein LepA n=1 Tax=uncultured Eudoraea sp. TaxID=1035614 RepID=UPI002609041C|nr:GTP-binding protein LepA [uncultured Eudoraea sp.]